ncbi:MAG: hypothetical protein EZS28_031168 [Streblomastix strix]|uniref:ISXO2-like transposase domain-containing protein n=1 Tax=Streblomastix strix TaxID=222440 RepID=A0A5J4USV5_9EUKA|nr:MAG: hypothetical protein EZS28_031168 [Streblomastix strix]
MGKRMASDESQVYRAGVITFFGLMRLFCFYIQIKEYDILIGGDQQIVEIDEVIMRRRKWQRGKGKEQVWAFGGIIRIQNREQIVLKRMFIMTVPNRNANTLLTAVIQNIAPNIIIYSDSWKGYSLFTGAGFENKQPPEACLRITRSRFSENITIINERKGGDETIDKTNG